MKDVWLVKTYIRHGRWWWVFRYRNGRQFKVAMMFGPRP